MMIFGIPYRPKQLAYLFGDVVFALVAIFLGHALRFGIVAEAANPVYILTHTTGASVIFLATHLGLLYVADAYDPKRDYRALAEVLRFWIAVVVALVVQMAVFYALPNWWWGRGVAALSALGFGVLVTAWRFVVCQLRPAPATTFRTLVVGAGRAGEAMADAIADHRTEGPVYDLVGFVDDTVTGDFCKRPVLGGADRLLDTVRREKVDTIIVAIRGGMSRQLTAQLLACKARGVQIEDMPTVYKRLTAKVPINHLADTWMVFGPAFAGSSRMANLALRAADIVIALIGLALTGPIILVAALLVRLDSPGPAFFTQERIGLGKKPFTMIKLRTMRQDAEAKSGAVWSMGDVDPRVTRLGRFLRRSRIDELPQFVNVLRGDMAVIGPRPERDHFVRQLEQKIPFYSLRFSVKPGLTGWAQVMYRYGASEEDAAEKLRYELFAIQEMSPVLYMLILLKTVQTVLWRPGS